MFSEAFRSAVGSGEGAAARHSPEEVSETLRAAVVKLSAGPQRGGRPRFLSELNGNLRGVELHRASFQGHFRLSATEGRRFGAEFHVIFNLFPCLAALGGPRGALGGVQRSGGHRRLPVAHLDDARQVEGALPFAPVGVALRGALFLGD